MLVSPVRPVQRFAELTRDEVSDLFLCVHRIAPVLQQLHSCPSLSIALQDGKEAGQTVQHVHVHMLPRKEGDFPRNDDIYEKVLRACTELYNVFCYCFQLEKHDVMPETEQASHFRSEGEMQLEAAHLAKFFT